MTELVDTYQSSLCTEDLHMTPLDADAMFKWMQQKLWLISFALNNTSGTWSAKIPGVCVCVCVCFMCLHNVFCVCNLVKKTILRVWMEKIISPYMCENNCNGFQKTLISQTT